MRVFLSPFKDFSLAIPIQFVSSVILFHENQEMTVDYDERFNNTYISLPMLLNVPSARIKHGLILKNENDIDDEDDETMLENRFILLTAEIESEIDFPQDKIFSFPRVLSIMQMSLIFNGIIFNAKKNGILNEEMVLLVNPVHLIEKFKGTGND